MEGILQETELRTNEEEDTRVVSDEPHAKKVGP